MTAAITTEKHKRNAFLPVLSLVIAIGAATFASIFMKLSQEAGLASPIIATGRLTLAALILTPITLRYYSDELRRLGKRDLLFAMLAGFWIVTHFMLMIYALEQSPIMLFMLIINMGPLWTALLERFFLKARLSPLVWLGLFVTLLGTSVIAILASNAADSNTTMSVPIIGLTLLSSVAGSIYITIGRNVRRKVSLIPYIWIVFSIGGLLGMVFLLVTRTPLTGYPSMGYFWLLMLTLIPQLMGHGGFNYAVGHFPVTLTSIAGQSLTITAAIAAFFIFGEVPQLPEIIGGVIIIPGILLAIIGTTRSAKVKA